MRKYKLIPSIHFWDTVSFESHDQTGHVHSWLCPHQQFSAFTSMQNISQFHLFILQIQSILEPKNQIGHTHFLTMFIQKILISLWFLSICINMQKMTLPLKFVNSAIWLAESILVNISGTRLLPKTGLCRITANNVNFYYRTNSVKINDQLFLKKFKKTYFWPISPIFAAKSFFFSKNSGLVMHKFIRFSSTMPIFREI